MPAVCSLIVVFNVASAFFRESVHDGLITFVEQAFDVLVSL